MNNFLNEVWLGAHLIFQTGITCFNNLPAFAKIIIVIVVGIGAMPVFILSIFDILVKHRLITPCKMSDYKNDHKDSALFKEKDGYIEID